MHRNMSNLPGGGMFDASDRRGMTSRRDEDGI